MWRRVLTYQLILAVAVGPLLCCCSVGKSLAGSPPTGTPASAPARVPAERVSHSCCSHKHAPTKSDSGQKSAPAKPGQPAEKCPCKDGAGKTQLTQSESTQADISTFLRALAFDTLVSFVPLVLAEAAPQTDCSGAGGCLDHAISPTDELLYAHHNLRC
jgi:hypothetical protein